MRRRKDYEVTKGNVFADLNLDASDELLARAKLMHEVYALTVTHTLPVFLIASHLTIKRSSVVAKAPAVVAKATAVVAFVAI